MRIFGEGGGIVMGKIPYRAKIKNKNLEDYIEEEVVQHDDEVSEV